MISSAVIACIGFSLNTDPAGEGKRMSEAPKTKEELSQGIGQPGGVSKDPSRTEARARLDDLLIGNLTVGLS